MANIFYARKSFISGKNYDRFILHVEKHFAKITREVLIFRVRIFHLPDSFLTSAENENIFPSSLMSVLFRPRAIYIVKY